MCWPSAGTGRRAATFVSDSRIGEATVLKRASPVTPSTTALAGHDLRLAERLVELEHGLDAGVGRVQLAHPVVAVAAWRRPGRSPPPSRPASRPRSHCRPASSGSPSAPHSDSQNFGSSAPTAT